MRLWSIMVLLFTCLIIFVSLPHAEHIPAKHVIVIDPAHGGSDRGTGLSEQKYEKDITLMIAGELQRGLEGTKNLSVRLTRTSDVDVPLAERIKVLKDAKADLFISLHINAGFAKKAAGYEVYFPGFHKPAEKKNGAVEIIKDMTENKYLNDSVSFSQTIMRNLQRVFPRKGRGLREAPMSILEGLSLPAVVVEIGFATNVEDNKLMLDDEKRHGIVQALSNGIKEFYHIK